MKDFLGPNMELRGDGISFSWIDCSPVAKFVFKGMAEHLFFSVTTYII